MWSDIKRWLFRLSISMAVAFIAAYATDWAIYTLRGSPSSTILVNRYLEVPLKGQKEEYDFEGSSPVVCAVALFPQGDKDPCWLVWHNRNKWDSP
jgi:hypothetical protein